MKPKPTEPTKTQKKRRENHPTPAHIPSASATTNYDLVRLFTDQDPVLVRPLIPFLVAWVSPVISECSVLFEIRLGAADGAREHVQDVQYIRLSWELTSLKPLVHDLEETVKSIRSGRTPAREQTEEYAAYGLAFVAVSVLMPKRRIVTFRKGLAPDLLFDVTPNALAGVEVAGRSSDGFTAFRRVKYSTERKVFELRSQADIKEVHLSLWCVAPRVSELMQVKP